MTVRPKTFDDAPGAMISAESTAGPGGIDIAAIRKRIRGNWREKSRAGQEMLAMCDEVERLRAVVERLTETITAMGLVGDVTEVVGKRYWADLKEGNARLQYILDAVKSASRDGRLDAFTVDAVIDYAEAEFAEAAKGKDNG